MKKRPTIAQTLHNHIKFAKRLQYDKPPICTCQGCTNNNPTQFLLDTKFLAAQVSSKTTPFPQTHNLEKELAKSVKRATKSILNTLDDKGQVSENHQEYLAETKLALLHHKWECAPAGTMRLPHTKPPDIPTCDEVASMAAQTTNYVRGPVDKSPGDTWCECPKLAFDRLIALYKPDGQYYKLVSKKYHATALRNCYELMAKFMKYTSRIRQCSGTKPALPYGYALPKGKDYENTALHAA